MNWAVQFDNTQFLWVNTIENASHVKQLRYHSSHLQFLVFIWLVEEQLRLHNQYTMENIIPIHFPKDRSSGMAQNLQHQIPFFDGPFLDGFRSSLDHSDHSAPCVLQFKSFLRPGPGRQTFLNIY